RRDFLQDFKRNRFPIGNCSSHWAGQLSFAEMCFRPAQDLFKRVFAFEFPSRGMHALSAANLDLARAFTRLDLNKHVRIRRVMREKDVQRAQSAERAATLLFAPRTQQRLDRGANVASSNGFSINCSAPACPRRVEVFAGIAAPRSQARACTCA